MIPEIDKAAVNMYPVLINYSVTHSDFSHREKHDKDFLPCVNFG